MKILFLCTGVGYGGASKMMINVANHFSKKHDVTILSYREENVLQELDEKISFVYNRLYVNNNKLLQVAGQIVHLKRYIKKEKFDLAVAFLNPPIYMLVLAAMGLKTKILLSDRGDPYARGNSRLQKIINVVFSMADLYVFQTEKAMRFYNKRVQKKAVVIPNPISNKSLPLRYDGMREKTVVNAARMELWQKRQDVLIDAFSIFHKTHPEYTLILYGDGEDYEKIKEYAKRSSAAESIFLPGAVDNVPERIKRAGMFVLSSDFEGIPNALLEAMAVGVPCISTDCSPGGARVMIEDGKNGYIVPCGDIYALAQKMSDIAENPDKASVLSEKAVAVKEKFANSAILERWEKLIEHSL